MRVTRRLINWCDTKFNEAVHEENDRKANVKAFTSGAVEGFMDAAIVLYVPVVIMCHYYMNKAAKK